MLLLLLLLLLLLSVFKSKVSTRVLILLLVLLVVLIIFCCSFNLLSQLLLCEDVNFLYLVGDGGLSHVYDRSRLSIKHIIYRSGFLLLLFNLSERPRHGTISTYVLYHNIVYWSWNFGSYFYNLKIESPSAKAWITRVFKTSFFVSTVISKRAVFIK